MAELNILDLGRLDYDRAMAMQHRLVDRVRQAPQELAFAVMVEHDPPVLTLGRGADANNIVAPPDRLARAGVTVHRTSRGGEVTYHGPGQLVCYPILRLDLHGRDLHKYLRDIEQAIIDTLGSLGVAGARRAGMTGVWCESGKVAAIGVAVRKWVSYHGLALNVCPDLSHFELIVPCGLTDTRVTSLAKLTGSDVRVEHVKPILAARLANVFGFDRVTAVECGRDTGED